MLGQNIIVCCVRLYVSVQNDALGAETGVRDSESHVLFVGTDSCAGTRVALEYGVGIEGLTSQPVYIASPFWELSTVTGFGHLLMLRTIACPTSMDARDLADCVAQGCSGVNAPTHSTTLQPSKYANRCTGHTV